MISRISKHLMLKFIRKKPLKKQDWMHFKTSYVEVYLVVFLDWIARKIDFKTSYVEVYQYGV